ncbi:MAG TPA: hypothetical protein VJ732_09630 [Bryobacteraceae bacterium]|nr:hypothetical protein [Bryobacteraceae bacterium]
MGLADGLIFTFAALADLAVLCSLRWMRRRGERRRRARALLALRAFAASGQATGSRLVRENT